MKRVPRPVAVGSIALLPLTLLAPVADAVDSVDTQRLRKNVTVSGILEHERVFQRIANNHNGTRASGTSGYDASVRYVAGRMRQAGYNVRIQEFTFPFYQELAPAVLEQVSPDATQYETVTFEYSGSGDVTGELVAINPTIPPPTTPGTSPSGCTGTPFPAAPAGPAVALIQRGTCTFEEKAANAQAKGYEAVIIFNEGQEGRTDPFAGTLGRPFDIPVVGLSFADGADLVEQLESGDDVTVHVATETDVDPARTTYNVLANSPGGNPDKTVIVGGHLDSVIEGPGINDNGSGVSTILEIAEEMSELGITPRQRVRFAFWGAEESGLLGSEHYVANLSDAQLQRIVAVLNFDMLGSPNYARFVYDGDGSGSGPAGPPGSAAIETVFTEYFDSQGLASEPSEFNGRSDYGPFIAVGIPAGGLFSGAEGIKTEAQVAMYGGRAGIAYDPCYHEACDDIFNVSAHALNELGDAAAHAVLTLAKTRSGLLPDGSMRAQSREDGAVGYRWHSHHPRR